jgi:N4-(beta-N-acetylglucosaminyl)-L-asparaginase
MRDYIAIATWKWGETAVKAAVALLAQGRPALDAVIAGGQAVEDDPAVHSVGYGGVADAAGNVTLDAAVMEGRTLNCGAVAGVENVRHVSALARKVMEATPHLLLVGEGARQFALRHGFPLESLHTPQSVAEWERTRAKARIPKVDHATEPVYGPWDLGLIPPELGHDTVTVLARDAAGDLAGCSTTSGLAHKVPGRVGDSPLVGHGLYVDNAAGAAGGTGVGEEIIRVAGSFAIVEAMRAGATAQAACEAAVRRVIALAGRRGVHPARVAFVALDAAGTPGAAATRATDFVYAVARPGTVEVHPAVLVGP